MSDTTFEMIKCNDFFLYIHVIARIISNLNFKHICSHVHVIRTGYCLVLATILQTHLTFWCEHHFSLCMSLIWSSLYCFFSCRFNYFHRTTFILRLTRDEFHIFVCFQSNRTESFRHLVIAAWFTRLVIIVYIFLYAILIFILCKWNIHLHIQWNHSLKK